MQSPLARDSARKEGKFILEIPDINRTFDKIDEYIALAKQSGIDIVFRPE